MKNRTVAVTPLAALLEKHLEDLRVKNYSEYTVKGRRVHIGFFLAWCTERGITEPVDVTRTVLESYQRYVFHYRKKNGEPLGFTAQHARLVPLRFWFKWLARQRYLLHSPASELELPRTGHRLPKHVLTAKEAELGAVALARGLDLDLAEIAPHRFAAGALRELPLPDRAWHTRGALPFSTAARPRAFPSPAFEKAVWCRCPACRWRHAPGPSRTS
jgi:hypothetical protein